MLSSQFDYISADEPRLANKLGHYVCRSIQLHEYIDEPLAKSLSTYFTRYSRDIIRQVGWTPVGNGLGQAGFLDWREALHNGNRITYGAHASDKYGEYDYIREVLGLKSLTAHLLGQFQVAQNAGYWSPYAEVCLISERYNRLRVDDNQKPHCEDGMAIAYPDGWGIYAWHGVNVPKYVIMQPDKITPDTIMSEENAEVARVMLERYGQDNFIRDGGFRVIQSDDYGDLYRVQMSDGYDPIVAVHVKDPSTDREYFLYVPPHIRTAHEGVAWTFGYDNVNDYHPDQET